VLFDFRDSFEPSSVATAEARANASAAGSQTCLRVETQRSAAWPGVTLRAPGGRWNLSAYGAVTVPVKNVGTNRATLYCRVDNPGADGTDHCLTRSVTLEPGGSNTIRVELKRTSESRLDGKLFGMRGYPVVAGGRGAIDPANVTQLLVFVSKPDAPHAFELGTVRATGTYTPPTACLSDAAPFFAFIDTFGQYRHKDWPRKTKSMADLASQRDQEKLELASQSGPPDWNRYGGWATGPSLQGTGFFRTEKYQGKWWLVDPDGRLFWSHGCDCVRMLDATPIDERDAWFADFPGNQPAFAAFVIPAAHALKGHYAGRSPRCFSFAGANLARKYGPDWQRVYPDTIHLRLRSWGLNTIANWSDERVWSLRRTPYTDTLGSHGATMIAGSEGYWGKFPDVFDPAFRAALRRQMAAKNSKSAGDPWCLGYFSDNEMSWGDDVSLAFAALTSPASQPAKVAFLARLRERYGDIAKLNAAWGTAHASWDTLSESAAKPDPAKAGDDLRAFYTETAEHYFRIVREVIKEAAPHQLYLGCRFAWVNARAATAAAKYCDVVSYNLYQRTIADFRFNGGADVPLIVGEFHFGALDRGLFHPGLVPVENQTARAAAYTAYVGGALKHPQMVGTHWFQYQDEPTTGRVYDEENYQIGFVDIADTPYAETIAATRAVGRGLYRERIGP
jgi:hypothetical protein